MLDKEQKLRRILRECGSVLVGFSGGTDSAYLLAVAARELGNQVLAVTAVSATSTQQEIEEVTQFVERLGVQHLFVESREMELQEFTENSAQKCYHCKLSRFSDLVEIAHQRQIPRVLDGSNWDDLADFRPGSRAIQELKVRSPLQEAGLTKAEIRECSKRLGLTTWDKPSSPCLASRIPYGEPITEEKLRRLERAEKFLAERGFSPLRVRHVGQEARLELAPQQFSMAAELAQPINKELIALGFARVTLDLAGFRSGSLNEDLGIKEKTI